MADLSGIYKEFEGDLHRVEHLLRLIKGFREFGASSPPQELKDATVNWVEAVSLHTQAGNVRTDLPVLSGSLQLYLSGRFEYFVRQVVEAVAEEIASHVRQYSELPENLRQQLRALTLEVVQAPRRYGYDEAEADSLLAQFVAVFSGATPPTEIGAEVLSLTDSNMKDRILADLMKRVGMSDFWREVGKQAPVKMFLNKATDGETTAAAQSRLNQIMEERNQIAHPTADTQFPDPDKVLSHVEFLRVLATTTTLLLTVYLRAGRTG